MATVLAYQKHDTSSKVIEQLKKRVAEVSKMHPVAKVIMALAALLIVSAAIYTGYHNYELYGRVTTAPLVALVPPILLDGSMLLLLAGFIFWFTDPTQKVIAGIFNVILFVIVGLNTSLNGSMNAGESLGQGMALYLHYGIVASFLLVLAGWMLIFHFDPIVKRNEERAKVNAEAQATAHETEMKQIEMKLESSKGEVEFQLALQQAMHSARMKALDSEDVQGALVDLEKEHAINEARNIRGSLPLKKS